MEVLSLARRYAGGASRSVAQGLAADSVCSDVITMAERHLRDVSRQIHTLQKFEQELSRAVRQWKRAGKQTLSAGAICTLIERTNTLLEDYMRQLQQRGLQDSYD